jgi:multisubunit Na+/H+ antiporter MnhB subunit
MLIALIIERRSWYYPPMMLLAVTAIGRIIAWLLHDATLAVSQIMVEVTVTLILLLASRRLPQEVTTRDQRQ